MKRFVLGFLIFLPLVSCESLDNRIEMNYAVMTDHKVSMVILSHETDIMEYQYEYYSDGRLKSIIPYHNGMKSQKYEYSYEDSGYSINVGKWFTYQFDDMQRPSECKIFALTGSSYEDIPKVKYTYNDDMLVSMECPDGYYNYEWNENGDVAAVSAGFEYGGSLKNIFTYSNVINNFDVPIPGLCLPFYSHMFSEFCYGIVPSKHLPDCLYERDELGNIIKMVFDGFEFSLQIHYF